MGCLPARAVPRHQPSRGNRGQFIQRARDYRLEDFPGEVHTTKACTRSSPVSHWAWRSTLIAPEWLQPESTTRLLPLRFTTTAWSSQIQGSGSQPPLERALHVLRGSFVRYDDETNEELMRRSTYVCPHAFARMDASADEILSCYGSNHIHAIPSDHVEKVCALCKLLDVDYHEFGAAR
jgi:hypothetical protein